MIHRPLAFISFACCALVVASFVFFTTDQLGNASRHQQDALVAGHTTTSSATAGASGPRRLIDKAASQLTSPYEHIVQTHNAWLRHALPAVIALFVYGFGIGAIVRYLRR